MSTNNRKKIIPLLNDIASRLWDGHAAVLVGAGFSRNAKPTSNKARKFPMWNDLGDLFYEKVYCESNLNRYSNVLKLGDEVQAAFGRNVLDKIIQENIPDKEYEPSQLHKELLSLPWVDVFTTNYDTLLERASVFVESRKYDLVVNKNDLMNAEKPRIIKLHGSFPSERPFIITEEDYRRYPIDFSTFVNTVQQSLIENTLCLIGFSGDDPNFLNWIGWIRDNLGSENSPKIFLIGLFSFNEAQRKLLERRNIVIVDLNYLVDNVSHYISYECFFDFLIKSKKEEFNLKWPTSDHINPPLRTGSIEQKKEGIKEVITSWSRDRESFPNWCIVPEDNRRRLWSETEYWLEIFSLHDDWDGNEDIKIAYEIVWRINKSLMPIFDDLAKRIFIIIDRYEELYLAEKNDANLYIDGLNEYFPFLIINLMRYCRQEGLKNEWLRLSVIIIESKSKLSPEIYADYEYENVIFSYYNLDIDEAISKISSWERNAQLPFHEAKRAGLLAEFGMVDESISILESSLATIRRSNRLMPSGYDYANYSQESYIMLLTRLLKNSLWRSNKEESVNDYTERLAVLSQYRCDPINEMKFFEIRLEQISRGKESNGQYDFDLGRRSSTISFLSNAKDNIVSYAFNFLLFAEEIGLPFRIPPMLTISKSTAINASVGIYEYCPEWALFSLLRIADEKSIGRLYNRSHLRELNRDKINEILEGYLIKFKEIYHKTTGFKSKQCTQIEFSLFNIIPEILSRLVAKCSFEKKKEIFEFLSDIFNSTNFNNYGSVKNLIARAIKSLSTEQKIELIPLFIKFPSATKGDDRSPHDFVNPFEYLVYLKRNAVSDIIRTLPSALFKKDVEYIKSGNEQSRRISSTKMIILHELGFLNKSDIKKLIKAIWSKTDEFGFPKYVDYYRFYFIKNLHPAGIDVAKNMMEYLNKYQFPIHNNSGEKGITITNGRSRYCMEFIGASAAMVFSHEEIDMLVCQLEEWFECDRGYLSGADYKDIKEEFESRLLNIVSIVTSLSLHSLGDITTSVKERIVTLLKKMNNDGLVVMPALISIFINDSPARIAMIDDVYDAIISTEEKIIQGAIRSLYILHDNSIYYDKIIDCLVEKIKWNCGPCLSDCIIFIAEYIAESSVVKSRILMDSLVIGLEKIMHEDINMETEVARLEKRVSAAKLASHIHRYLVDKGEIIPEVILDWKLICNSSDEFDEVKNSWVA
ncbi:anti-phage defense-associated sirtuin Dsr2 [Serratia fonticola]|uniref:anti-phage defense-associated sirtuin Dsr2 n=1 Tax=Serratia fonticola TaxID=47917 RepID=UPI001415429F|nr:anti-phage defense-associated sirtuin Dsr2 [Serratia fonticola]QIP90663.1 hypothetical protein HAP32_01181 [Serratia fonticola]